MYKLLNVGLLYLLLIVCGQATAVELEDFRVLILGPMDGKAVLKLPDGKMQVVGNGQSLPGTQATVKQILKDRLVVEDLQAGDPPSMQTVWIFKAVSPSEKSRVERLQKTRPPQVKPTLNIVRKPREDK